MNRDLFGFLKQLEKGAVGVRVYREYTGNKTIDKKTKFWSSERFS